MGNCFNTMMPWATFISAKAAFLPEPANGQRPKVLFEKHRFRTGKE